MNDDYLCLTLLARPGEPESEFSARLSEFWTFMLRSAPDAFEKVYAETTKFVPIAGKLSRQYLCELDAVDLLEREFARAKIDHQPIDRDDVFSKYEAVPPEWMQIEH